jgi:predicted RecA/RadA family phage recombinase
MKNFIQRGEILTLAAPYDVASGEGLLVGAIFGVATSAALSGAAVETSVCGVHELAKTSAQAWTVGAKIYWDDTAKVCTTVTTSNTLIGVAVAAAANPSAAGLVRLNGSF